MQRGQAEVIPGSYWSQDAAAWLLDDPTPEAAAITVAVFPELLLEYPVLGQLRDQLYTESVRPVDHAGELDLPLPADLSLPGRQLFEFQRRDIAYLLRIMERDGGAFIGWDRGLGKTTAGISFACAAAAGVTGAYGPARILIICSNTAKGPVWEDELKEFMPDAYVELMPNDKAKREESIDFVRNYASVHGRSGTPFLDNRPLVYVCHYESLALVAGDKGRGAGWDKLGDWDLMIFDEAHRLASMVPGSKKNTQLGRATMKVRRRSRHALALTGSAILGRPADLFGELHFVFPDTYKAKYTDWMDRFAWIVKAGYGEVVVGWKPERVQELRDELGVFLVHRTKADELDLPERTVEWKTLPLKPRQARAYEELRDQFWTQLENGTVIHATSRLAQLNLLRRVATGLDEFGSIKDSSKLDYAFELVRDNPDEAFVIFSWYKAPLYALRDRLAKAGETVFAVTGDVPHEQRAEDIAAFQAGKGRVFLGTISTLGESVNLHRATNAIFLDRSWTPAHNDQAADRIYRIGQDKPVTITHLVAEDTVDELRVLPALASKESLRKAIFR